ETPKIVFDLLLLESLASIGKTSFDQVEIMDTNESSHACTDAALNGHWKIIKSSPGRVDVTRRVEASVGKQYHGIFAVRINGESSQFSTLRILPQAQCQISISD